MDTLQIIKASISHLIPAITLLLGGSLLMCASVFSTSSTRHDIHGQRFRFGALSLALLLLAMVLSYLRGVPKLDPMDLGLFRFDASAIAAERLTFIGGLILVLMSWSTAPKGKLPEYYGCLLILLSAIPIVGASNDLVSLFLGLELVSIPTYILLGIVKTDNTGAEAALKYFLLSAFASCFFLLGLSYLYGVTGSTNLVIIQDGYSEGKRLMALALLLTMCGLSFRITAVPFHFYAPDVFDGTSVTLAGIMSYLPKVAGFVALVRLIGEGGLSENGRNVILPVLLVCAALTMCVGNLMASAQNNLRRLLAYSSIAHTGYLLLALVALLRQDASANVLYSYLAAYAAMTLGMFACLGEIEAAGGRSHLIGDLTGMFYRRPAASIGLTVALLSLIGLPLTAGFWAKFFVFVGVVADRQTDSFSMWMAVLMAFNAVVAAGYYWRILSTLFEKSESTLPLRVFRPSLFLAYTICTVLTIVWFFVPSIL
ncbi:MAG: NADH-quinone oxidoreductase subunit N [Planctomycetota bacterium]